MVTPGYTPGYSWIYPLVTPGYTHGYYWIYPWLLLDLPLFTPGFTPWLLLDLPLFTPGFTPVYSWIYPWLLLDLPLVRVENIAYKKQQFAEWFWVGNLHWGICQDCQKTWHRWRSSGLLQKVDAFRVGQVQLHLLGERQSSGWGVWLTGARSADDSRWVYEQNGRLCNWIREESVRCLHFWF